LQWGVVNDRRRGLLIELADKAGASDARSPLLIILEVVEPSRRAKSRSQ